MYEFGNFRLNAKTHELLRAGIVQKIEPQVFAVLLLLIKNQDRIVTQDELIERIWHGRTISNTAVSGWIKRARKAIGDDGKTQRLIKTIHGCGFRFIGQARRSNDVGRNDVFNPTIELPAKTLNETTLESGKPTVLVLPFSSPVKTELLPVLPVGFA